MLLETLMPNVFTKKPKKVKGTLSGWSGRGIGYWLGPHHHDDDEHSTGGDGDGGGDGGGGGE